MNKAIEKFLQYFRKGKEKSTNHECEVYCGHFAEELPQYIKDALKGKVNE